MAPAMPSCASSARSESTSTIGVHSAHSISIPSIPSLTTVPGSISFSATAIKPPLISTDINTTDTIANQAQRLELAKSLESALSKFQNVKKNASSTHKANILRLQLLPFLRYPIQPFQHVAELLSMSLIDLNASLLKYEAHILLNWLSELLNILYNDYASIAAADRNCYYECASRLLSQNIWQLMLADQNSSQFLDIIPRYTSLSLKFFEFTILRINGKSLSLSASVLAGKVFAYAFINIPDISRGLSFLLNTKLTNYKKIHRACLENCHSFPIVLNDLAAHFPDHLIPLLTSSLHPRSTRYTIESYFINAIPPPQQKIEGIRETKGVWVNRWCSLENVSLFASFYRHYLSLCSIQMRRLPLMMVDEYYTYGMPGFLTLLTHIYEVFQLQIRTQVMKAASTFNNRRNSTPNAQQDEIFPSVPMKALLETPIDKLLAVLRDFLAHPRHPFEKLLRQGVIRGYEHIIKLIVSTTSLLDTFAVDAVLGLLIKFCKAIDIPGGDSKAIVSMLDWKFWMDVLLKLLKSGNVTCQVRAISTLYILWNLIPESDFDNVYEYKCSATDMPERVEWLTNSEESLKLNFARYIVSDNVWKNMLGHYMPLVRYLYAKLLVWKILGVSSIAYSMQTSLDIFGSNFSERTSNYWKIKSLVDSRLRQTFSVTEGMVFTPTDPVLHRKFVVTKVCASTTDSLERDRKLRVYPWEVFDDAVYTSSTPTLPNSGKMAKNTSKISLSGIKKSSGDGESGKRSWMGKLFKKSDRDEKNKASTSNTKHLSKFLSLSKTPTTAASSSVISHSDKNQTTTSGTNSTSNSSVSISSKGSPISSLASSFSSLELTQHDYAASSAMIGEDSNVSQPPEWKYNSEAPCESFEFKLVPDEERITTFLKKLNGFNNNNNGTISSRFCKEGELVIINDEPRLAHINPTILATIKLNASLESVVEANDSEDEDDCFVDANLDLNGGFGGVYGVDSFTNDDHGEEYGYTTGTKILDDGKTKDIKDCLRTTPALLGYISNGLLAFNEEIVAFEKFIIEQLKELGMGSMSDQQLGNRHEPGQEEDGVARGWYHASSSSSLLEFATRKYGTVEMVDHDEDTRIRLNTATYEKLKRLIPGILPDITGDKLNAY